MSEIRKLREQGIDLMTVEKDSLADEQLKLRNVVSSRIDKLVKSFYKNIGRKPNLIIIGEEAFYSLRQEVDIMLRLDHRCGGFIYKDLRLLRTAEESELYDVKVGLFKTEKG